MEEKKIASLDIDADVKETQDCRVPSTSTITFSNVQQISQQIQDLSLSPSSQLQTSVIQQIHNLSLNTAPLPSVIASPPIEIQTQFSPPVSTVEIPITQASFSTSSSLSISLPSTSKPRFVSNTSTEILQQILGRSPVISESERASDKNKSPQKYSVKNRFFRQRYNPLRSPSKSNFETSSCASEERLNLITKVGRIQDRFPRQVRPNRTRTVSETGSGSSRDPDDKLFNISGNVWSNLQGKRATTTQKNFKFGPILNDPGEISNLSFDAAVVKLRSLVQNIVSNQQQNSTFPRLTPFRTSPVKNIVDFETGEQSCGICHREFTPMDSLHRLNCGHIFHLKCILESIEGSGICPVCNMNVQTEEEVQRRNFPGDDLDGNGGGGGICFRGYAELYG